MAADLYEGCSLLWLPFTDSASGFWIADLWEGCSLMGAPFQDGCSLLTLPFTDSAAAFISLDPASRRAPDLREDYLLAGFWVYVRIM